MTKKLPFRYNGSCGNMYDEIMRFVPYCDAINTSTEAFVGSGVWTLNKPRHEHETINDKNGELVNFMWQLRDNHQALINAIKLTPYARDELILSYEPARAPLERARRFYVRQMQSRNHADQNPNWKRQFKTIDETGRKMTAQSKRFSKTDHLFVYAERLQTVQIENRDGIKFLVEYDHDHALHFIDPPFLPKTRENEDGLYLHEMTEEQHIQLVNVVVDLSGYSIVRHYKCGLYEDVLACEGFQRVDFNKRIDGAGSKTESLYLSPNLTDLLHDLQSIRTPVQLRGL